MVRYNLFPVVTVVCAITLVLFSCQMATAQTTSMGVNIFGFPLDLVSPDAGAANIPGQGYTYNIGGYALPDFGATYGFQAQQSPLLGGSTGYIGPNLNGLDLGVAFGLTQASHDASDTAFSKDLAYEANLENTFIAFPGIGVGSLGVGFPTITDQKSDIKYMESVKFEFSTESNKFQVGGFGYPLGLGLGYSSAMVGIDPGQGIFNSSYFFG